MVEDLKNPTSVDVLDLEAGGLAGYGLCWISLTAMLRVALFEVA
jgi:hypothetical protein